MIKSVTATNHLGESLTMELMRPEKSGFIVKSIEGLNPVNSEINSVKLARSHGARYNSSRLATRSIVLNIAFYDDGIRTVESLRHTIYKYFPDNNKLRFTIESDTRTVYTDCYVESNEVEIFSNDEICSITLFCPDPFLYSTKGGHVTFNMIEPAFEFPFPDEIYDEVPGIGPEDPEKLVMPAIEFGIIRDVFTQGLYYDGDCDTGMEITLSIIAPEESEVINPIIYNNLTKQTMRVDTEKLKKVMGSERGLINGDVININTNLMEKSITLTREGVTTNILNCLEKGTKWLTLKPGNNELTCAADNDTAEFVSVRIDYNVAYGGI